MSSSSDMLQKLENLLLGNNSADFRLIESLTRYFCPFEAVGMVRQEIRHSNFLGYMLDPARPHGLSDILLRALVMLLIDRGNTEAVGRLDMHFRAMTTARVFRERDNIDVLIEIPPESGQAGIVLALELKIDAAEGADQLQRYQKRIISGYPGDKWQHLFGFITKDGGDANSAGEGHDWIRLSWGDLLDGFGNAIRHHSAQGRGVEMFQDYAKMMKRHNMADGDADPRLSKAVRDIWAHHKEALEYLIDNRPDALGDLQRQLSDDLIIRRMRANGIFIEADNCEKRIRRFYFPDLLRRFPRLLTGSWVKSGSVFVLEVDFRWNGIDCAIVVGPSKEDSDFRDMLTKTMRDVDAANKNVRKKTWRKMFFKKIVDGENSAIAFLTGKSPQEAAKAVADRIAVHIAQAHPKIEEALERASR